MVKWFGRGDKDEKEFEKSLVASHVAGRAQGRAMDPQRALRRESLGRAFFLQEDESVDYILRNYCPELIPAFSRLNATSKIDKERDRRTLELLYEILLLRRKMEIPDDEIAQHGLIDGLGIYAKYRILDAMGGYRGRLITEEIERTTVSVEQPKKKGFL